MHYAGSALEIFKRSDRLDMIVKLRMQYYKEKINFKFIWYQ